MGRPPRGDGQRIEMDSIHVVPNRYPQGEYLLLFDPLDGSSNIDVNVEHRHHLLGAAQGRPPPRRQPSRTSCSPVRAQAAAGYCVYGPQTTLVLDRRRRRRDVHATAPSNSSAEVLTTTNDVHLPGRHEGARDDACRPRPARWCRRRWWPVHGQGGTRPASSTGPRGKDFNLQRAARQHCVEDRRAPQAWDAGAEGRRVGAEGPQRGDAHGGSHQRLALQIQALAWRLLAKVANVEKFMPRDFDHEGRLRPSPTSASAILRPLMPGRRPARSTRTVCRFT